METRRTHGAGLIIGMEQRKVTDDKTHGTALAVPPGGHTLRRAGDRREAAGSSLSNIIVQVGGVITKRVVVDVPN